MDELYWPQLVRSSNNPITTIKYIKRNIKLFPVQTFSELNQTQFCFIFSFIISYQSRNCVFLGKLFTIVMETFLFFKKKTFERICSLIRNYENVGRWLSKALKEQIFVITRAYTKTFITHIKTTKIIGIVMWIQI